MALERAARAGVLVAALALGMTTWACAVEQIVVVEKEFQESQELVLNPDCGWVAYNYEDGYNLRKRVAGGQEPFRFASVVYTRHPARSWEDDAGGFHDSPPLRLLKGWMAHGRDVGFRVYANGPNDLPDRLRTESVTFRSGRDGAGPTRVRYWSDGYVAEHRRLVQFLGRELSSSPRLAFVDIGGVGNSGGEWFLDPFDAFEAAGLDQESYCLMVEEFVGMYRAAFPETRLFISYDAITQAGSRSGEIVDLLVRNRVGVRDDNLGGWPYPRRYTPRKAWPLPDLKGRLPVLYECGGRGGGVYGIRMRDESPQKVLEWAFDLAPPMYVNLGGSETASEKACTEMGEFLREYGRQLGYRFVLLRAACPSRAKAGTEIALQTEWTNRGRSPCYGERSVEIVLDGAGVGIAARSVAALQPPVAAWKPGSEVSVPLSLRVPAGIPTGRYDVKLRMLMNDPRDPNRVCAIATQGSDEDGRFVVGALTVE